MGDHESKSTLTSTVYLQHEGNVVGFGPGDDLPDEVARQIGAHAFEDGVHPLGDATEEAPGPPPQAGAGSSTSAWEKYASDNGVEVEDGSNRSAIIDACKAAGVPVDQQQ